MRLFASLYRISSFSKLVVLKVLPKKTLRKYHAERSLRSELEIQSHVPFIHHSFYFIFFGAKFP